MKDIPGEYGSCRIFVHDKDRVMIMFQFGNVVVVDEDQIGCIVKSWSDGTHDVYVRSLNGVRSYRSSDIKQYIYSKELSGDEREYYDNIN